MKVFCGPGTIYDKEELNEFRKAVIPMQFDGMNALQVLEEVAETLTKRVSNAEQVLKQTQRNIADMKNTIDNIHEFLEEQADKNRSKVHPSQCRHMNKIVVDDEHAEVVTCADCGLMLSYKRL